MPSTPQASSGTAPSPTRVYGSGTSRNAAFRGRDNKKIQFTVLAIGATRGGIEPDLLDEVVWWQADDFWWYALAASVAVIRSCAERRREPVPTFVVRLAKG